MDLMDLKPKTDVVEIILKHPSTGEALINDDGNEMTITVYAQYSKEYRAAMHEQQDKRLEKLQNKGGNTRYSSSDLEADSIDLLSKITKNWDITYGGETPKLSKAKEIYTEVFWLRNQVEEALTQSADFITA